MQQPLVGLLGGDQQSRGTLGGDATVQRRSLHRAQQEGTRHQDTGVTLAADGADVSMGWGRSEGAVGHVGQGTRRAQAGDRQGTGRGHAEHMQGTHRGHARDRQGTGRGCGISLTGAA